VKTPHQKYPWISIEAFPSCFVQACDRCGEKLEIKRGANQLRSAALIIQHGTKFISHHLNCPLPARKIVPIESWVVNE
jgi:hypothetical protein